MAEVHHNRTMRGSEKLHGRDRRSLNLSTKGLTAVEAKASKTRIQRQARRQRMGSVRCCAQ